MFCKYFRVAFLILNKYFRIAFRTVYSAAFLCPITISYPASVGSVDSSDLLRMRWMLNVYLESYDVGFQKLKLFLYWHFIVCFCFSARICRMDWCGNEDY